jgi:lipid A ethanolaminephosphotransferase
MGLRLFHITEFAQSRLSPAAQREARHPAALLLLASLWLALAGNLPLWRELGRQPMDGALLCWIALCFALLTTFALAALLSILNWSWLLRPAITLLLCLAAVNSLLLWSGHGDSNFFRFSEAESALVRLRNLSTWPLLLTTSLLAGLPTLLLWQTRLRRIPLSHKLPQNLLLLFMCIALLAIVWFSGRHALLPLLQDQPRWLSLLTPFNTLLSLWR